MKIAGYIITILGALALIGTILGGHSPIGPLFWVAVGVVLLILGYRKKAKDTGEIQRAEHIDKSAFPLVQRIVRLTTPDNFMEPYDAKRVKRAVELNKQANDIDGQQPLQVLDLIETTAKDLGCIYEPELIYQYLLAIYKPTAHQSDFEWCNNLCQQLYSVKDSVGDMISLVRSETAKREQIRKEKIERLRQEVIKRHQLENDRKRKNAIRLLKVCAVMIAILIVFFAIYIPIDYHRINKNARNIWSLKDFRVEKLNKYENRISNDLICYLINIPKNFDKDKYDTRYLEKYHIDSHYYTWRNSIDVAITSRPISDFVSAKVNVATNAGFKIEYIINTDTLVWYTYDKYSLSDGRLVGNCICILKPSPLQQSPFPVDTNNIMICCDGYGLTKEVADSIAESLRIQTERLPNNKYCVSLKLSKYGTIANGIEVGFGATNHRINNTNWIEFGLPWQFEKITSISNNEEDETKALFLSRNNNVGLRVISCRAKTSEINHAYPVDSIAGNSSTKCKIAGCDATKIEATGYYNNREYKYISYQLIKDNGYSEYKEPIYGKETYYLSDKELASSGYTYVNGERIYYKSRKQNRNVLKGYKPGTKKIKNDDLYLCLLFGMTPEWYENNKDSIDAVINSIQISEK